MSTVYYGIKNENIALIGLEEFKKRVKESDLNISYSLSGYNCISSREDSYEVCNDQGCFDFHLTADNEVVGSATRYGKNCDELLESILSDVFQSDYILTEHDYDELVEIGIIREPTLEELENN